MEVVVQRTTYVRMGVVCQSVSLVRRWGVQGITYARVGVVCQSQRLVSRQAVRPVKSVRTGSACQLIVMRQVVQRARSVRVVAV